jgi:hypothetical protein
MSVGLALLAVEIGAIIIVAAAVLGTKTLLRSPDFAVLSRANCVPWASGTSLPASPWQNGLDRFGVSAWTTSLSWARPICARFCNLTHATTTSSELSDHWIRMRRSLAKFSESEAPNHTPSLADFITTTSELRFSVHTGSGRAIRERLAAQFLPSITSRNHLWSY